MTAKQKRQKKGAESVNTAKISLAKKEEKIYMQEGSRAKIEEKRGRGRGEEVSWGIREKNLGATGFRRGGKGLSGIEKKR